MISVRMGPTVIVVRTLKFEPNNKICFELTCVFVEILKPRNNKKKQTHGFEASEQPAATYRPAQRFFRRSQGSTYPNDNVNYNYSNNKNA